MGKITDKFRTNPTVYYALSICATWAGIGSLMNGITMTQTLGVVPSAIWVLGNTLACIIFGLFAVKIPKLRDVFCSKPMMIVCGVMCVFQSWLSMNGVVTVFSDTSLGEQGGFHRWTISGREPLLSKLGGKVPVVIVDHHGSVNEDIYGTITHNRARGVHLLEPMKAIVKKLMADGKSVQEIGKQLGMKPEEIFRLSGFSRDEFLELMTKGKTEYSKAFIPKRY